MKDLCTLCGIEPVSEKSAHNLCETCELSLFQINQILEAYIEDTSPPFWITKMARELDFIYERNLRTRAYFNAAQEVTYRFSVDKESSFLLDDVEEINQSQLPRYKVIEILESAYLAEIKDSEVFPGAITKKLQDIRWEGYTLETTQMALKLQEIKGILSIALTKALIETKEFIPRAAMSILNLLSLQILEAEEEIGKEIKTHRQYTAFAQVTPRQARLLQWAMAGFEDSRPRICKDIDDEGNIILKDTVLDYLTKMRERWRERGRERTRSHDL